MDEGTQSALPIAYIQWSYILQLRLSIHNNDSPSCTISMSQDLVQVIGDWVASRTHEEVLAVMGEARVPSGELHLVLLLLLLACSPSQVNNDSYCCLY